MFEILLLILLAFIVYPLAMAGYKVWRLHRRMRQFMQDPFGQQQQQRRQSSNPFSDFFGSRKTKQRRNRRKKIPRGVGEYVEFTEVAGTVGDDTSANGSKSVKFKKEEQIQDIEWEDI